MGRAGKNGLKVPGLGQVGIVVEDIPGAIDYYEKAFGIGPWAIFEGEPECCTQRGEEITFRGRIAMATAGSVQVELIQILEGGSIHSEFLAEVGEGIHHLGFFVRDLDARLRAAEAAGIGVLHRGTLKQMGLTIEYAYMDTTSVGGVIIEFIEARFMRIPFPMRSRLLRWGASLNSRFGR